MAVGLRGSRGVRSFVCRGLDGAHYSLTGRPITRNREGDRSRANPDTQPFAVGGNADAQLVVSTSTYA